MITIEVHEGSDIPADVNEALVCRLPNATRKPIWLQVWRDRRGSWSTLDSREIPLERIIAWARVPVLKKACATCDGNGFLPDETRCTACDGMGNVNV